MLTLSRKIGDVVSLYNNQGDLIGEVIVVDICRNQVKLGFAGFAREIEIQRNEATHRHRNYSRPPQDRTEQSES